MSENQNTPVSVEPHPEVAEAAQLAEASSPDEAAAPSTVIDAEPPPEQPATLDAASEQELDATAPPEHQSPAETAPEPTAAATPAESSEEDTAKATAAEAKETSGDKSAKQARAKKSRRGKRRPGKPDEVVAPTPEDLAGIPSDAVRAAVEAGHPVEGLVIGWNQGGFHVAVDGVTGFCPRSSMELGAPKEPAQYLDQKLVFRVLRVEDKGHRLVLSHAAMLREERKQRAEELKRKIAVGAVLKGRVISLTDFGAFVDLGGVEGLIHVSEIRHQRIAHPSEALAVGQEVETKVIKLASGGDRFSLSLRALEPDPWDGVAERFPAGGKFSGKVLRGTDFGWFIEVEPGIEGLLHHSQLLPGMTGEDPRLAAGETIEGWVREVDSKRKRLSLALRETPTHDPWHGVERRYAEGAIVRGTVEKVERFGAFISLEPGLTALLPNSEMGLPRGANIARIYSVGKQVKLQIAQVDARRRRISLTIESKTLEGSRSDYQSFLKQSRRETGLGAMAAALEKLRETEG